MSCNCSVRLQSEAIHIGTSLGHRATRNNHTRAKPALNKVAESGAGVVGISGFTLKHQKGKKKEFMKTVVTYNTELVGCTHQLEVSVE